MDLRGIITKGVGGKYTVKTDAGAYVCGARGKFRVSGVTPLVGDFAVISVTDESKKTGYLTAIEPRINEAQRPRAANIGVVLAVFSVKDPDVGADMMDNVLLAAEWQVKNSEIVVCVNKTDVAPRERVADVERVYGGVYKTFAVSAVTGRGVDELREYLRGKTVVAAGPSGVGKSSLLNALLNKTDLETGALSERLRRGKHTTRHAELFAVGDGAGGGALIADTPGFSSVKAVEVVPRDELAGCFPEFRPFLGLCRYTDCRHDSEDGCAIKEAVGKEAVGKSVSNERYERYLKLSREQFSR